MPKAKQAEMHIPNTDNIKDLLNRAATIEDEIDECRAEKKDLAAEIKAAGIYKKAFTAALKQIRTPLEPEFVQAVNSYLEESGQHALFV